MKKIAIAALLSISAVASIPAHAGPGLFGGLLGATAGAAIGRDVGGHNGAVAGAVLGAVIGSSIERDSYYEGRPARYYETRPAYGTYYEPYYAPAPVVYGPQVYVGGRGGYGPYYVSRGRTYERRDWHDHRGDGHDHGRY